MIKIETKEVAIYKYDDWNNWNTLSIIPTKFNGIFYYIRQFNDLKFSRLLLFFEDCDDQDMSFVINEIKNSRGFYNSFFKRLGILGKELNYKIEIQLNEKIVPRFYHLFPEYLI
jgi:hypothetical protein